MTSRSAQIRCSSQCVKPRPVCPPDTVKLETNVVRVIRFNGRRAEGERCCGDLHLTAGVLPFFCPDLKFRRFSRCPIQGFDEGELAIERRTFVGISRSQFSVSPGVPVLILV